MYVCIFYYYIDITYSCNTAVVEQLNLYYACGAAVFVLLQLLCTAGTIATYTAAATTTGSSASSDITAAKDNRKVSY